MKGEAKKKGLKLPLLELLALLPLCMMGASHFLHIDWDGPLGLFDSHSLPCLLPSQISALGNWKHT